MEINVPPPQAPTEIINTTPSAVYESSYYRDWILEAIDKLRERKARPDAEKIAMLLKRYHKITINETERCLNRLTDLGEVICVDYKGSKSYRNPQKWRKSSSGGGILNSPGVSQRLVEAVRLLLTQREAATLSMLPGGGLAYASNSNSVDHSFTFDEIEQLIKANAVNCFDSWEKIHVDLTGSNLSTALERECVHGALAKTPNGRYVLDENGAKKKILLAKKATTKKIKTLIAPQQKAQAHPQPQLQPQPQQQTQAPAPICQVTEIYTFRPECEESGHESSNKSGGTAPGSASNGSNQPTPGPTSGKKPGSGGKRGRPLGSKNKKVLLPSPDQPPNKKPKMEEDESLSRSSLNCHSDQVPKTEGNTGPTSNNLAHTCIKCGAGESAVNEFLICKDCAMKAHPSCLGYWPELADRARPMWQCSQCKTCAICQGRNATDIHVCDACDRGFHASCHQPPIVRNPTNGAAWVCRECLQAGHSVVPQQALEPDASSFQANGTSASGGSVANNKAILEGLDGDPREWSVDDVYRWMTVEGFTREAKAFREQEIDGASLLLMKRMDVLTELGIKLGPAVKIFERIKRLQSGRWSYGDLY